MIDKNSLVGKAIAARKQNMIDENARAVEVTRAQPKQFAANGPPCTKCGLPVRMDNQSGVHALCRSKEERVAFYKKSQAEAKNDPLHVLMGPFRRKADVLDKRIDKIERKISELHQKAERMRAASKKLRALIEEGKPE